MNADTNEIKILDTDKIINDIVVKHQGKNGDMIYIAYRLACAAHRNQVRRSGAPYVEHPVEIANIASDLGLDATAITACLLHDVVEDTKYTLCDIESLFGRQVSDLVDGVTKLAKIQYSTTEEQQVENLRKMFLAMAKDIRVVIIKLIDRLHNMRTLKFMTHDKQLEKARETLEVYAPLAHRLGMSKLKIELEDLSLKYLDPISYEEIRENINQKKDERLQYIEDIKNVLEAKLKELGIDGKVTGRAKHFYSIFRKMYMQNKTMDEIYDLFALRVIVNTVGDCYAVLGAVHELYTPVPMRVKDYIAMPKPNMYQSLHTTLIGPNGTPFEIQIRTKEMHKIAEEGIAAHWKYKEGVTGQTDMDSKLEWVRQLLETQEDTLDTDDFFNTLKIDLFADEVFVFTPQGKVICLPAKSTVIDFAFAIHSEVGYKMSGAKVNGKIVPNNYIIQNGEIIEILNTNTHGPSRDWLKIVRTNQAKNKINQWFKKQNREVNIITGKEMVEKEIRRLGFSHAQLFRDEWVQRVMRRYSFQTVDDLYAGIGYGGLSAQKVVMSFRDYYKAEQKEKREKELAADPQSYVATTTTHTKRNPASKGIIVKGIDNCLVRLSGCCNPVPGDEIVGFITRGRGVSVHRKDCPNMNPEVMLPADKGRFIDVFWEEKADDVYMATIQIESLERDGLMLEVTALVTGLKLNMKNINAYVTKKNVAVIQLGCEIRNTKDLDYLMKKLRQISGVTAVKRISN